jgi:hypothetical protein
MPIASPGPACGQPADDVELGYPEFRSGARPSAWAATWSVHTDRYQTISNAARSAPTCDYGAMHTFALGLGFK